MSDRGQLEARARYLDGSAPLRLNPVPAATKTRYPPTSGATALPTGSKVLIYESLISFLKDACRTGTRGRSLSELARFQLTLDGYLVSMSSDSIVSCILGSLKCRKILLELSSELGLDNDPNLRKSLRTDRERIAAILVSIFDSQSAEDVVLRLEGDSAQCFLDVVLDALDGGFLIAQEHSQKARRIIRKLSESCDKLPSALFITGVSGREEHPTFGGGYGDIYRASYNNKPVALKHMRHFLRGSELHRIRLKFCREALVWRDLHHPNILPFIGIDRESFSSSLSMVSPWMEHGTILKYLEVHGRANMDKLLFEIAQGLQYLHSRNIVHGDLRGTNILINEEWSACLTDFGLSVFSNATSSMRTSTRAGSLYWMAPELIEPDRFGGKFVRTPASDVYAFGCVCIEVYTGRPPFSELSEAAALLKTVNGERPGRPSGTPAMSDMLWKNVTAYWTEDPTARPSTEVVVQDMTWPAAQKSLLPNPEMPSVPSGNDTLSTPGILHQLSTLEPVQPVHQHNPIPNSPVESPLENNLLHEKWQNKSFRGREHTNDDHSEVAQQFTLQWWAPGRMKELLGRDKPKITPFTLIRPVGGILHTPKSVQPGQQLSPVLSSPEERLLENYLLDEKKKGKNFWGRERRDNETELTRKIGFLVATGSENWSLVLDVCEHASASENNAKEAVGALRREFKSGDPAAQLAAARLWAIMLRNSSETFISQSTSRKFLNTLEDLLTSSRTSPVVCERAMDVLAAAAYASGPKKDAGFRGLWRRVKPRDKPEEGVPFDTEDAMFNPPPTAQDYRDNTNSVPYHVISIIPDAAPVAEQPLHLHRIIPPDEVQWLLEECRIGVDNAMLLSQALGMATLEDLDSIAITEFHKKCVDSQELIFTQVPWVSVDAERSRVAKDQEERERDKEREHSANTLNSLAPNALNGNGSVPDLDTPLLTLEEKLLADLLAANADLLEAIKLYEDLKLIAIEHEEVRMDPLHRQYITEDGTLYADAPGSAGSSRSRSPSSARAPVQHPQVVGTVADLTFQVPPALQAQQTLAPPPAAPHGPRLPGAAGISRTPLQVVGAAVDLTFQARPALQALQMLALPPTAPHGPRLPARW